MTPAVVGAQSVAARMFGGLLQRGDNVADWRFGFSGHQERRRACYMWRRHRSPVHISVLEDAVGPFIGRDARENLRARRDYVWLGDDHVLVIARKDQAHAAAEEGHVALAAPHLLDRADRERVGCVAGGTTAAVIFVADGHDGKNAELIDQDSEDFIEERLVIAETQRHIDNVHTLL